MLPPGVQNPFILIMGGACTLVRKESECMGDGPEAGPRDGESFNNLLVVSSADMGELISNFQ